MGLIGSTIDRSDYVKSSRRSSATTSMRPLWFIKTFCTQEEQLLCNRILGHSIGLLLSRQIQVIPIA